MIADPRTSLRETAPMAENKIPSDRVMSVDYRQGMRTVLLMDAFEQSRDGITPTYDRLMLQGVFSLAGTELGFVIARKPYFMPWCGEGITLSGLLRKVGGRNFTVQPELPVPIVQLLNSNVPVLLRAQNSRNREGHGRRFGETSPYLLTGLIRK